MPDSPDDKPPVRRVATDGPFQARPPFESVIDRQIREAMEDGTFDNLPHQGEPLPNDENPYAGDRALAFHMLKNASVAPPWIEADKEVRELLAQRDTILARAAAGVAPSALAQRRGRAVLEDLVARINRTIARVNADAPTDRQHRRNLVLADELAGYDEACRR
jgi:hypothetical protein